MLIYSHRRHPALYVRWINRKNEETPPSIPAVNEGFRWAIIMPTTEPK